MKYSVLSEIGKRKKTNDDMVYASEPVPGKDQGVFMVCRGFGPQGASMIVNTITCNTIGPKLIDWLQGEGGNASYPGGEEILRSSIQEANSAIRAHIRSNPEYAGMSSSFALVMVLGIKEEDESVAHTLVSNMGECVVYAIGRKITRLTEFHTVSADRIPNIRQIEGVDPKKRVVISRCLGMDERVDPPVTRVSLRRHIRLLLCTPGVPLHLSEEEIHATVKSENDPATASRKILKTCMDAGGADNISAIIVQREDFLPS